MKVTKYIRISDFCRGHELAESFVYKLHEIELIEIFEVEEQQVIHGEELERLERLVRLHRDLQISPQGLLAVDQLLTRMEGLQAEVLELRRRLNRWE